MNKNVVITNLQRIITNMQQVIDNVTSICDAYNCSTQQVEKLVVFLRAKLQDEENYKKNSFKNHNDDIIFERLQSEKATLKKLINDVNFDIYLLEAEASENKALQSEQQRDYAILADSLNISENDEQIYAMMKDNEAKSLDIQKHIDEILGEIDKKKENLVNYNNDISSIDDKMSKCTNQKSFIMVDLDNKGTDERDLNALNNLLSTLKSFDSLDQIANTLVELKAYVGVNGSKDNYVDEKIKYVKSVLSQINDTLLNFLKVIDVNEWLNEKDIIIQKSNDEVLNENDRKKNELKVENLKLNVSLLQSDIDSDEQTILDYTRRINKIDNDISELNISSCALQKQVNQLNLKMLYFPEQSNDSKVKGIKRLQKQIDLNKKNIEKLIKDKVEIENCIRSIKKIRKNSESLKNDMQIDLADIKDMKTSIRRFKFDDNKQKLILIDFAIELNNVVKNAMNQNYAQMLGDIDVETLDSRATILSFTDYKYVDRITNLKFIEEVKNVMEQMTKKDVPEQHVKSLAA